MEATLLGIVLAADGLLAFGLGAPGWLAGLYIVLGFALATVWVRVARRRRRVAAPPRPGARRSRRCRPRRAARTRGARSATSASASGRRTASRSAARRSASGAASTVSSSRPSCTTSEASGDGTSRPSLRWALEQIADGQADLLVVTRLRDLSTNVANLRRCCAGSREPASHLIALDLRLDTATDAGRLAAEALAGVGGWEHERISERTRRGLEAARSRGGGQGRTAVADVPELQERIAAMREQGMTLQAIADVLNEEGVPTLRGGAMWRPVERPARDRLPPPVGRRPRHRAAAAQAADH